MLTGMLKNVSSQKIILDSSFGKNGIVNLEIFGSLFYSNTMVDHQGDLYLNRGNVVFYFDSFGLKKSVLPRMNPDTFISNKDFSRINGSIIASNNKMFTSYSKNTINVGEKAKYFFKKLELNNLMDTTFDPMDTFIIGANYETLSIIDKDKNDNIISVINTDYKYYKLNQIELLKINDNGILDRKIINLDHLCTNNYAQISFINMDVKNNYFYIPVNFQCSSNTFKTYLIKSKSDLSLDSTFGSSGIKDISIASLDIIIRSIIVDSKGEIYLILNDYINKRIKIRNLNSDGELDNTYGDNGEFIIPEFTFEPGFQQNFNYDSISNSIYFFAYNGSSQSKLFVVKSDGSLDTNYELNGGFYLDGKVINLNQVNNKAFIATVERFDSFGNSANFMLKFIDRTNMTGTKSLNPNFNPKISILDNEIIIFDVPNDILKIELLNSLGLRIEILDKLEYKDRVIIHKNRIMPGMHFVLFTTKDHKYSSIAIPMF